MLFVSTPARPSQLSIDIDEYLRPRCTAWNLDTYYSKTMVLRALQETTPMRRGTLLDVGCGWSAYRSVVMGDGQSVTRYIGMDLESGTYLAEPDLKWDGKTIPLPDASIDCAMATEVLEHCPSPDTVLKEIYRVLKPGGSFFMTVPFLWPLHDTPYDEYRYTPFSLDRHLANAGFTNRDIRALGGWDAALATMIGLWVRRRNLPHNTRRVLQRLALPFYRWLVRSDVPPKSFESTCMITGLSATAVKPHGDSFRANAAASASVDRAYNSHSM